MSHPLLRWQLVRMRHRVGNILQNQGYCESIGASPHNSLECEIFNSSSVQYEFGGIDLLTIGYAMLAHFLANGASHAQVNALCIIPFILRRVHMLV
jgi:hypothetical protein